LYDGPFCVLSIVDHRAFKRLCYEVLDHTPSRGDIRAFFQRFQAALAHRELTLRGITTDGSDLDPRPIAEVFGAVKHQVCRFHILAELNKAVLRAVAQVRKHLTAQKPALPRGRPGTPEAKRKARRSQRLERKRASLFEHRHLFVKRRLTPGERRTLQRISRGLPRSNESVDLRAGPDVPPDHAARLVLLLASVRADALSGRFFTVADDVLRLVERAKRGELGELQTLRLSTTE
jgi:hypothetical protein